MLIDDNIDDTVFINKWGRVHQRKMHVWNEWKLRKCLLDYYKY